MISACMTVSVRELRTAVREWACCIEHQQMTKLSLADIGVIYLPFLLSKQTKQTSLLLNRSHKLCGVHIGFCADPVGIVSPCHHLCSLEGVASVPHIFCKTNDRNNVQASR